MPSTNSKINFLYGLKTNYDAITSVDANSVYFCTDTQQIFVGDVEYTRPVLSGSSLPTTYAPANSLFYNTSDETLYFSSEGTDWVACATNFTYTHPTYDTTESTASASVDPNGTIDVLTAIVADNGHVTGYTTTTFTINGYEVVVEGEGNAVTGVSLSGTTLTFTKGETFATSEELAEAIGQITSFEIDSNGGAGYASVDDLPTEGTNGVIYLVVSETTETGNTYAEYFWTGSSYEKAGQFGDVDLSDYALSDDVDDALAEKADKSTAIQVNLESSDSDDLSSDTSAPGVTGVLGTANGGTGTTTGHIEVAQGTDTTSDATPDYGESFTVIDDVTKDEYGHVTAVNTKTVTLPDATENTDTNVTNTPDATAKAYITGTTTATESTGTQVFDTDVYLDTEAGVLVATTFKGDLTGNAATATQAESADSATTADSATQATQDADGNVITETYATKEELEDSAIVWGSF